MQAVPAVAYPARLRLRALDRGRRLDLVRVLARHQVDHALGDRHGGVGEPLVGAAQQGQGSTFTLRLPETGATRERNTGGPLIVNGDDEGPYETDTLTPSPPRRLFRDPSACRRG
ncbi:hypothetical protein SBADM41S_09860 [Streptomyces badius]